MERMSTLALNEKRVIDKQTLAEIYQQYSPGLFRYSVRLLGDRRLAEDCVAETFSRYLKTLKSGGEPPQNVQAYLYRVARNWITDQFRRQPPPPLELKEEVEADHLANPARLVAKQMERERVHRALLQLTEEQREVIVLRFLEGWSHEQIAASLEKNVDATRAAQARGLKSLRRILIEPEDG
jgi:RNA polymerase sigma-70 factor, ECF subfamily